MPEPCEVCGLPRKEWLCPKEIAAHFSVSLRTVNRWAALRKFHAVKLDGQWHIKHCAFDHWLQVNTAKSLRAGNA